MSSISKIYTIAISGASCSGKTTFARNLLRILPNSTIMHQDDFYKPEAELPIEPTTGMENWDCPEAIDFPAMASALRTMRRGEKALYISKEDKNVLGTGADQIPDIVISELKTQIDHVLSKQQQQIGFIIVDGFLLYVDSSIVEQLDFHFYMRAPREVLKARREGRSYVTLEGNWTDPPGYFDDMIWPQYVKWCSELFGGDIERGELTVEGGVLLDGTGNPEDALRRSLDILLKFFEQE